MFGAFFKTKLTLYNPGVDAITIRDALTPDGPSQTVVISRPTYNRWDNFLDDMFATRAARASISRARP